MGLDQAETLSGFMIKNTPRGDNSNFGLIFSFNNNNLNKQRRISRRVGKVLKIDGTVFNFFIEPQYTVLVEGAGQPLFQIYTAVNMQF